MVAFYVGLIGAGRMALDRVPKRWRAQVAEVLDGAAD